MRTFKVPLTADNQIFDTYMGGIHYGIELRWNAEAKHWTLDISDYNSGDRLIDGIPIVTGCNLLEQFKYFGIPGELITLSPEDDAPPDYTTLGVTSNLFFYSDIDYPE